MLIAIFLNIFLCTFALQKSSFDSSSHQDFPIPINISVAPVVLIPGIGGSILVDELTGLHVWIRFYEASYYFQRYLWGLYDEKNQTLEPFAGKPRVTPRLSGYGLDAIRNLDPSVDIWPVYDYLSYFDAMIRELTSNGWVPGYSLFGVPWDWRQSQCWPPTLSRMKDTILLAQRSSGRNVTLISHSMGSLVVKCFMATYPDVFEAAVDGWIAIASPFQGAGAKIFSEFLQGYNLGNIVIAAEDAKGLSLQSPAVYELLPSQSFSWSLPPSISFLIGGRRETYDCAGPGDPTKPQFARRRATAPPPPPPQPPAPAPVAGRFDELLRSALAAHQLKLPDGGGVWPEPFSEACWNLSLAARARAAAARPPPSLRYFLNVVGVAQPTPVGLDCGAVKAYPDLQAAKCAMTMGDGDGTVPAESARGHGVVGAVEQVVAADHMGVLTHPQTLALVLAALYGRL